MNKERMKMIEKVRDFLEDDGNHPKIRYMGFSMAVVGMVVAVAAIVVASVLESIPLIVCAMAMLVVSFILLPVTDINFSKRGWY